MPTRALISLAALLAATPALAQTPAPQPVAELETVTVYGTQSQLPVALDRVGASVTVLTQRDIREQGNATVADALRRVPGVNVAQSGSRGSLTQVRIRGGEANHTLVLIDGVAVNSPDNGDFDFSNLPVDDITRIEVIRGPQSGVFGPNANGGVVVIETRSGRGIVGTAGSAHIEGGSNGTMQGHASVQGGNGTAWGAVTVQGLTTAGTNISRFDNERDGSRAGSLAARFGAELSPYVGIEGMFRVLRRQSDSDPQAFFGPRSGFVVDGPDNADRLDVLGSGTVTTRLLDGALLSRTTVSNFRSRLDFFTSSITPDSVSDAIRTTVSHRSTLLGTIDPLNARTSLTGLVEHNRESFYSFTAGSFGRTFEAARTSTGVGGEARIDFASGLSLSGAVRNDYNDAFEDAFTWRATAAYTFAPTGTTFHASAGRGVTNPTFYEQFGFFPASFVGNPSVRPESSVGVDGGVRQQFLNGRAFVDVTLFRADLTDVIQTQSLPGGRSTVVNVDGRTERRGVEVVASISPTTWLDLKATYTRSETEDPSGQRLLRRPTDSATFEAVGRFLDNRLTAAAGLVYVGSRDDLFFGAFPATRVRLDPYTLVNARVAYQVNPNTEFYVRGENLTNVRYEDVFSYRTPGAAVYAGMRVRFGE